MSRILIAYYSFSGATRSVAEEIAKQTGGDLRELVPQKPYTFAHNTAAKEARSEITRGYCPALLRGNEPIEGYETVFVGTPNWFKAAAPPVISFLTRHDFTGKTVIPFCTHGGGGLGEIAERIAEACPGAAMRPGLAAEGSASSEEVAGWLRENRIL